MALLIVQVESIGSVQVIRDARSSSEAEDPVMIQMMKSRKSSRLATDTARKQGLEAHQHGSLVQGVHVGNTSERANGRVWGTVSEDQTQPNVHPAAAAAAGDQ